MRRHLLGPLLFPFAVANFDRNWGTEGESVADPSEDGDLVGFELHTRSTTEAKSAAGQLVSDLLHSDGQTGRKAFENNDEGLAMGFTGGQITQH
ncbi:unannotated protein [freshwater metagenome]|uniref:Unannotated protein n=1 Tax=freshwater metagenome TaxID=449393 RepID=A0A6J7VKA8_9ZZZZ